MEEIAQRVGKCGIWVFDRGNDDKAFFSFLASKLKVRFITRVKDNRQVVLSKTGGLEKVKDLKPGKYRVHLLRRNSHKVDPQPYTLVIQKHLKNKPPIRLITNLEGPQYSKNKLVTMYLERWGVENSFRRIKTKFNLEKVRVLGFQKLINLVALIQFASVCATLMYRTLQKTSSALIAGLLLYYRSFLRLKSLSPNIDSFIAFMQFSLKPFVPKDPKPPDQISLFQHSPQKLGSF